MNTITEEDYEKIEIDDFKEKKEETIVITFENKSTQTKDVYVISDDDEYDDEYDDIHFNFLKEVGTDIKNGFNMLVTFFTSIKIDDMNSK